MFSHAHLSQPRPLNPDLDICFDSSLIHQDPPTLLTMPLQPSFIPTVAAPIDRHPEELPRRVWRESDYQIVPLSPSVSSISSSSSSSFQKIEDIQPGRPEDLNAYLRDCGLPLLDFSRMTSDNKDEIVRDTGFSLTK